MFSPQTTPSAHLSYFLATMLQAQFAECILLLVTITYTPVAQLAGVYNRPINIMAWAKIASLHWIVWPPKLSQNISIQENKFHPPLIKMTVAVCADGQGYMVFSVTIGLSWLKTEAVNIHIGVWALKWSELALESATEFIVLKNTLYRPLVLSG